MSKITERERGINVNKKYKIAVMGESNVGKTVFFGSYPTWAGQNTQSR